MENSHNRTCLFRCAALFDLAEGYDRQVFDQFIVRCQSLGLKVNHIGRAGSKELKVRVDVDVRAPDENACRSLVGPLMNEFSHVLESYSFSVF